MRLAGPNPAVHTIFTTIRRSRRLHRHPETLCQFRTLPFARERVGFESLMTFNVDHETAATLIVLIIGNQEVRLDRFRMLVVAQIPIAADRCDHSYHPLW